MFIEWERKIWRPSIHPPTITMFGKKKKKNMRTTVVDHSYLMREPLEDRVLSGFKISALGNCHPFIL